MKSVSTIAYSGTNILARCSRVAIQTCRDSLIGVALPYLTVEVSSVDQRARISIRASRDLLGYPVVQ